MAQKAPGKHYRKGITLLEAVHRFSDEAEVEAMFVAARWPAGVACPKCGSLNVQPRPTRKPQPFRCRDCRKDFSVKTGTVMEGSNLPLSKWALAAYLMTTSLKGVSSMKLHRDLGITQKAAWHLAHRIRKAWENGGGLFSGPVEIDETFIGGKETNKHSSKKIAGAQGGAGKVVVAGMKDMRSGNIVTAVVPGTDKNTLQGFVADHAAEDALKVTDELASYKGLDNHVTIAHKKNEYVREAGYTTNGIESHWALLKRGIHGTYHHISAKHTERYIAEFSGRHNARPLDTEDQIKGLVAGMNGKRLRYEDLIA